MILRSVVSISAIVIFTHGSLASKISYKNDVSSDKLQQLEYGTTESLLLKKMSPENHNGEIGVDSSSQSNKNSSDVAFDAEDKFEGREKKDDMLIPLLLGGFGSATISVVVAVMKMVVLKALFVAKIALTLTILLLVGKLMEKAHVSQPHVEVEHYEASDVYPVYSEYSNSGGGGYSDSLDGGTYGDIYSGYHGGVAESVLNYATVAVPGVNTTLTGVDAHQPIPITRRHFARRKAKVPMILTIRQYTKPS